MFRRIGGQRRTSGDIEKQEQTVNGQNQQRDQAVPIEKEGYATIEEGRNYLSLSRSKMYELLETELPTARFGRARRIPWTALREYARRCMAK